MDACDAGKFGDYWDLLLRLEDRIQECHDNNETYFQVSFRSASVVISKSI